MHLYRLHYWKPYPSQRFVLKMHLNQRQSWKPYPSQRSERWKIPPQLHYSKLCHCRW